MQSIGERLEEARKRKGISIREAAESTKIRSDYLHKFESNQYDLRLPEIYVRGFLRSYAAFLKLPSDKIIADYNALTHIDPKSSPRTVNREVYGRMDISTTKEPKTHGSESGMPTGTGGTTPPMAAESAGATAAPSATAPRNPVTFVPPAHSAGSPIDKKLLIKAGAIGLAVLLVLILIIVLVVSGGRSGSTPPAPRSAASASASLLPQPGERTFSITAKDSPVTIKVSLGTVTYYQGTLQVGEKRTFPRRVGMQINTLDDSSYTNLRLIFDGVEYPIQEKYWRPSYGTRIDN